MAVIEMWNCIVYLVIKLYRGIDCGHT